MNFFRKRKSFSFLFSILFVLASFSGRCLNVRAETVDYAARAEEQKAMPIESNEITGWPQGPAVSARAAILMEAETGTILYAKNVHEHLYPASTTKILTAYIARQNSSMDEVVEYSAEAINSIVWWDDSNIGIKIGESITMEQSLYGLLVGSGNECGNAIGEHISGSIEAFVALMNETAKNLGCADSHFVTTNGKHDDNHYTCAYDMALIAQRFFSDELLCRMSDTADYVIPQSPTLSRELIPHSKNKLFQGKEYAYEYLVGSKTGYTSLARQNLVSCAQKDGMKLICVVMCDESPMQFTDTIELFNYGFDQFKILDAADYDTTYSVKGNQFFATDSDIFGDSSPILSMQQDSRVVLPRNASFADLDSQLDYEGAQEGQVAAVRYSYHGQPVGSAAILMQEPQPSFDFNVQPVLSESVTQAEAESTESSVFSAPGIIDHKDNTIFLNIKTIAVLAGALAVLIILILLLYHAIRNRRLTNRRRSIMKKHRSKGEEIIDFDKYTEHYE